MSYTKAQLTEYNRTREVLGEYGFTDEDLDMLHRWEANLHTIAERHCNGYQDWRGNWDQKAADKDERKEERIMARVTALCESRGVTVTFNGDPRGGAIRLLLPAENGRKRSNSWDGETWGIYW